MTLPGDVQNACIRGRRELSYPFNGSRVKVNHVKVGKKRGQYIQNEKDGLGFPLVWSKESPLVQDKIMTPEKSGRNDLEKKRKEL